MRFRRNHELDNLLPDEIERLFTPQLTPAQLRERRAQQRNADPLIDSIVESPEESSDTEA